MDNNEIDKLKKRLYKKGEAFKERKFKSPFSPAKTEAKTSWEEPYSEEEGRLILPEKPKSTFRKALIIILAAIFSLAAAAAAIYFFIEKPNVVSSKNIEITLEGPSSIKGGEAGSWQVVITNKNKVSLELADLIIDYPEDSKSVSGSFGNVKNPSERRTIGEIKAGEMVTQQIGAYLFGEKDTDKIFKFTLEYRPQGSNAILAAAKEQTIRLLQSPVEIFLNFPKETNAGEKVDLEAEIISNAGVLIKNITFKMEYPAGFEYFDSDIKPATDDNIWRLGDLEPNTKRTVKIKGILEGQDLMELAFRASAGPLDEKGEVIAYGFAVQSIILKKPFLKLDLSVNGKTEGIIASVGTDLNVNIDWQNTLPSKINNAIIEAKISGSVVDQRTIFTRNGFYRSFDQTLVWNQSSLPVLASIDPLQEGEAQFSFSILDSLPQEAIRQGNLVVSLETTMKAQQITENQGVVEIENHLNKNIKIATLLQLSRRGLYYSGPFKNTGPLPPKVGKETTYTIVWSLTNSLNAVSDAIVSTFLPPYVRWLGVIQPTSTDVSYNQTTGELIWRVGAVLAGAGIFEPAKELAFQISFLPSANQINSQPTLVSEISLGGKDDFTGAFLRDVKPAITTRLDTDPQFEANEAAVVP